MSIDMYDSKVTEMVCARKFDEIVAYVTKEKCQPSTQFIIINRDIEAELPETEWYDAKRKLLLEVYAYTEAVGETMFIWDSIFEYFEVGEKDGCLRLLKWMDDLGIVAVDYDYLYFMREHDNYSDHHRIVLSDFAIFLLSNDIRCLTVKRFVFDYIRKYRPYEISKLRPDLQLLFL